MDIEIKLDGTVINNDNVIGLSFNSKMFNDGDDFKLGATICKTMKLTTKGIAQASNQIIIKPISVFNIDNVEVDDKDNTIITYTLVDNMVKFNFNYDASPLIEASQTTEPDGTKYVTLRQIANDICIKAGVNLQTLNFLGNEKHISYYDNTITAREYIGMIAELNGGYAVLKHTFAGQVIYSGLYFEPIGPNGTSGPLETNGFDNLVIGEKHKITRIAMENGLFTPVGDTSYDTIYLSANNVYITEQQDLQNIYDKIKNTEFCSLEVSGSFDTFDANNIGRLASITQAIPGPYSTRYYYYSAPLQINAEYNGGWTGKLDFKVTSKKQAETPYIDNVEEKYKRIKLDVDRNTNSIEILSELAEIISDEISGTGSLTIHDACPGVLHYLTITGQIDGNYPSSTTYPSSSTYPSEPADLVVDTTHYRLDIDVLNYISPSVCDKFIYEDGKCQIYRMVEVVNGVKQALATPYYEDRNDIEIFVSGDSTISLYNHSTANLTCKYLLYNDYTREFANKVETRGSIEVTNNRIEQTVSAVIDGQGKITPASIVLAINDDESSVKISGDKIDVTGFVTFSDLENEGQTQINGSNITTGTIDASQVNVTNINADNITSGHISANKISGGTINGNNVSVTNLSASNINTGTLNGLPITNGSITNAAFTFGDQYQSVVINEYTQGLIMGRWLASGQTDPDVNRRYGLTSLADGGSLLIFNSSGAYASSFDKTGAHTGSDIRYKKNINNIEEEKSIDIITNLQPIEYDYEEPDGQKYRGVSAQDVEMLLNRNGYYNQVYRVENNGRYSLNYEQLIPDLINCIKYLNNKVKELESKEEK